MEASALARLKEEHGRHLWALGYRLTGCAADADDLVQETFLRALERPPARTDEPIRPWLTRVAVNLGRDLLRARKRRGYVGPWLPSPIETDPEAEIAVEPRGTEGRYDLLESASMAFLLALEALTPKQRAVLLLCDVFDYSVREAAEALDISEGNVKTTHHRARRALDAYDRDRVRPTPDHAARTRQALERFLTALSTGDGATLTAMLGEEARQMSDGGGEFFANRKVLVGPEQITRVMFGLMKQLHGDERWEVRTLNGLPALVVEETPREGRAPRYVLQCEIDKDGAVRAVYSVLASRKLTAVRPISPT